MTDKNKGYLWYFMTLLISAWQSFVVNALFVLYVLGVSKAYFLADKPDYLFGSIAIAAIVGPRRLTLLWIDAVEFRDSAKIVKAYGLDKE